LKKYAAHFFNSAYGVTEEKEAAPAVTDVNSEKYSLKSLFFAIILMQKLRINSFTATVASEK
jgi:hypothetical protein